MQHLNIVKQVNHKDDMKQPIALNAYVITKKAEGSEQTAFLKFNNHTKMVVTSLNVTVTQMDANKKAFKSALYTLEDVRSKRDGSILVLNDIDLDDTCSDILVEIHDYVAVEQLDRNQINDDQEVKKIEVKKLKQVSMYARTRSVGAFLSIFFLVVFVIAMTFFYMLWVK